MIYICLSLFILEVSKIFRCCTAFPECPHALHCICKPHLDWIRPWPDGGLHFIFCILAGQLVLASVQHVVYMQGREQTFASSISIAQVQLYFISRATYVKDYSGLLPIQPTKKDPQVHQSQLLMSEHTTKSPDIVFFSTS